MDEDRRGTGPEARKTRVLITGGTGFIGSRLALRCLEEGCAVRVLGQENTPPEARNRELVEGGGAEVVIGSVTDREVVRRAADGMTTVFHLAAAQHEMNVPDDHFHRVNVGGTANVLAAAAEAGVARLVHGSTIGVYGIVDGVVDESSATEPDNVYGRTKLEAERLVFADSPPTRAVVVRIPETYGPGDHRLLKLFRSIDRGAFLLIGRGDNLHHPMYVDDLVEGLLAAAGSSSAAGETLLLAGKDAVTTREMAAAVAAALGRRPPRLGAPLAPFAALATVLEVTLRPIGIQPPLHRRRLDFFRKSYRLDASESERRLGFRPRVDFREGARQTVEWYRSEGLL